MISPFEYVWVILDSHSVVILGVYLVDVCLVDIPTDWSVLVQQDCSSVEVRVSTSTLFGFRWIQDVILYRLHPWWRIAHELIVYRPIVSDSKVITSFVCSVTLDWIIKRHVYLLIIRLGLILESLIQVSLLTVSCLNVVPSSIQLWVEHWWVGRWILHRWIHFLKVFSLLSDQLRYLGHLLISNVFRQNLASFLLRMKHCIKHFMNRLLRIVLGILCLIGLLEIRGRGIHRCFDVLNAPIYSWVLMKLWEASLHCFDSIKVAILEFSFSDEPLVLKAWMIQLDLPVHYLSIIQIPTLMIGKTWSVCCRCVLFSYLLELIDRKITTSVDVYVRFYGRVGLW